MVDSLATMLVCAFFYFNFDKFDFYVRFVFFLCFFSTLHTMYFICLESFENFIRSAGYNT